MPRGEPATVYLTFDDGPNPTTTPDLLDVLALEQVPERGSRPHSGDSLNLAPH